MRRMSSLILISTLFCAPVVGCGSGAAHQFNAKKCHQAKVFSSILASEVKMYNDAPNLYPMLKHAAKAKKQMDKTVYYFCTK